MQSSAPEAIDLSSESEATKKLYGLDDPATSVYGTNLLLARRLVERGVRFVECYSGSGSRWDAHSSLEANHTENCKSSDKPVAGLLADLKARGMLKDTLVVWGGEFGRTPFVQGSPDDEKAGRDHNPWGFTIWMAGGGVKGGQAIGTTDEIGLRAVDEPHHVHDIHASILYLLGLDHLRTTYMHNGRAERPTGTAGALIPKLWT
jgi:arylsulfatase A-like enzyme